MAGSAPSLCRICHSFQVPVSGREALCFHSPREAVVTGVGLAGLEFSQLQGQDCSFLCIELKCWLQSGFICFPMNIKKWEFNP